MCYNVKYLTKKKIDYARKIGSSESEIRELELEFDKILNKWSPGYLISGFSHPELPVLGSPSNPRIAMMPWGLIPSWENDPIHASKIQNQTLNCRIETMHSKPAFRKPAEINRCLIVLDGFYEHQTIGKSKVPHYIQAKNDEPLLIAGLCDEYMNQRRVSMVTMPARDFMVQIHNQSSSKEPRMPAMLNQDGAKLWLNEDIKAAELVEMKEFYNSFEMDSLTFYQVRPLSGKHSLGNSPQSSQPIPTHPPKELFDEFI